MKGLGIRLVALASVIAAMAMNVAVASAEG